MRESKQSAFIRNILVLIVVIGLVLGGWLAGHILRYSNPMFWHPPIEEIVPVEKIGMHFTPCASTRELSEVVPA